MSSTGSAVRCYLFGFLLLSLLLTGCATGGEEAVEVPDALREGHMALSEGRDASLTREVHPGLLRFWDDFERRVAVGSSFVVSDPGEENRYLRIAGNDESYLTVIPPYPNERPGAGDSRLRDFRLLFDLRLPEAGESTLYVAGRQKEGSEVRVTFVLSAGSLRLLEGVPGRERLLAEEERTAASHGGWKEVELSLLGREAQLMIDGVTLLYSAALEWLQPGGIVLSFDGFAEMDNLRLYAMEGGGEEKESALYVQELRDDFGGEELSPWWKREGNGAVEVGVPGGGARLIGSESYVTVSGISTRALFPREGTARVEFYDPPERTRFFLGLAKPTVADALILGVEESSVTLVEQSGGSGRQLLRRRLPPGAWSSGGKQELELMVAEDTIYGRLNGTPILAYRGRPEMFRGALFAGYLGHYPRTAGRIIRSVEMRSELPSELDPSAYPSGEEEGPRSEGRLPAFEKASALFTSFDSEVPHFDVGANESSEARAEVLVDESSGEGYLSLDFTMREGNGLHVFAGFGLEKDLSDYGGIAFRARGEGISRAHLSMNEIAAEAVGDRIDAFFPVTAEWREYRLPFTQEYFAPNGDHLLRGSDGTFDFAHSGWMLFEVYGYEGRGALHIDEIEFLPAGAKRQFTGRITVDNFEIEGRRAPFGLEAYTHTDGETVAEYSEISGPGARGSDGFGRLRVDKRARDHVELGFWGGIPAAEYQGIGFSTRGNGVTSAVVRLHELEEQSADLLSLQETHRCTIPLSQEWVEWRLPFLPGAMRPLPYNQLTDGKLGGWFVEGLSFSYPDGFQGQGTELHLDELFLFDRGRERSSRVGLYHAFPKAGGDRRVSGVIDSVVQLNLGRLEGYELRSGLDADSREAAFASAAEEDLDFFLRPLYQIDGNSLSLSLELCNVPAETVSKVIEEETVVGLDIFHDLDLLSTEVLNTLADTNLAFEDHLSRDAEGESVHWQDALDRVEPYWLLFDGVAARVEEGLRISSARGGVERRTSYLERPMLLSEPYLSGLRSISVELTDGATILWNYRSRDALNFLELVGGELRAQINGKVTRFQLPTEEDGTDRWRSVSLDLVDSGYRIVLDGQELGIADGYDVPYGRLGLAVGEGSASFRNLHVRFRE